MAKIIINHNLCDEAPECGGIEVCPTGAFYYDKKRKRVAIDESKCTLCMLCTLPDACPVGCILFARTIGEAKRIKDMIKQDPRTATWLWQERYGCQPGRTKPTATLINYKNFKHVKAKKGLKLIDIWHIDYLDCRVNSILFSDLLNGVKENVKIYKLDAHEYPELAKHLKSNKFPTLILMNNEKEIWRNEGLLEEKDLKKIQNTIRTKIGC